MPIFVEHWKDNLQFYPKFALFSTLGGMSLDHDFVQVSKLSENQKKKIFTKNRTLFYPTSVKTKKKKEKKRVFTKNGTLFPPNSGEHLRSDAHQSQIIAGDADVDHTQTIGGDKAKLLGGIYLPRVSAPLCIRYYCHVLEHSIKLQSNRLNIRCTIQTKQKHSR